MATKTAIRHPQKPAQMEQFYPYTLKINAFDASGNPTVILESPAAYEAAAGGNPGDFEEESPSSDRVLLPTWEPGCEAKQTAILSLGAFVKRFEISDVLPLGIGDNGPAQTLLIVTTE